MKLSNIHNLLRHAETIRGILPHGNEDAVRKKLQDMCTAFASPSREGPEELETFIHALWGMLAESDYFANMEVGLTGRTKYIGDP